MEFYKKVLYVRAKLNISQLELAQYLNVSFSTISRWESNKVKPTKKDEMRFDQFLKEKNIIVEE